MSWFSLAKLYEPDSRWFAIYAIAALMLCPILLSGKNRDNKAVLPAVAGDAKNKTPLSTPRKSPFIKNAAQYMTFLIKLRDRFITGAFQCAAIMAVQGIAFPFLYTLFAKYHKEPFVTRICAAFVNAVGFRSAGSGGNTVRLDTVYAPLDFAANWEKTGLFYFILILTGGFTLLFVRRAKLRRYAVLAGLCALYFVLRYISLIVVYYQYQINGIFWERVFTLFSMLPLAFIMAKVFANDGAGLYASPPRQTLKSIINRIPNVSSETLYINGDNSSTADGRGRSSLRGIEYIHKKFSLHHIPIAILYAAAAMFAFSYAAYFGLRDPGALKQGRVAVDEYHSDWEWTDEAYDENWFGERSGYNYYCFFEYIDKFYDAARNTEPISGTLLSQNDVLIIKTPTEPFGDGEIAAIHEFVRGGGGLYLIGDHTNVFGTGTNLNQIAPEYGIRFNYDCTYELTEGNLSEYNAPLFMPHPAVRRLPHFLFATSCTLDTALSAEDVILGYGLKAFPADFSQKNFFPEHTNSALIEFGAFSQCAAVAYGKGRVLAFADSTVFSNFWMHMRGKPELLLGSLDWLNRGNVLPVPPRTFAIYAMFISAVVAAAAALSIKLMYLFIPRHCEPRSGETIQQKALKAQCFYVCASFFIPLLAGAAIFSVLSHAGSFPAPKKPFVSVRFDNEYSDIMLPIDIDGFTANMDRQFSTFYVWTQRLGYVPSLYDSFDKALSESVKNRELAVVAKPKKDFANADIILQQVNKGAVLLILDNLASGAHSNKLLKRIGMEIVDKPVISPAEYSGQQVISGIYPTANASAVTGGNAAMIDSEGNALYSVAEYGLGHIAVFGDPDLFYNMELGDVSANLTEKTSLLTSLVFDIVKSLAVNPKY